MTDDTYEYECDQCYVPLTEDTGRVCVGTTELFCGDCADAHTRTCFVCDVLCRNSATNTVADGEVCDDCYQNFAQCHNCYRHENGAYMQTVRGGHVVCEHCADNDYFWCDVCDERCHDDEYASDDHCTACDAHGGGIQGYGYRPSPEFRSDGTDAAPERQRVYFGVELEVEAPDSNSLHDIAREVTDGDFHYAKEDASLMRGFELVSHPATLAHHIRGGSWRHALRVMRQHDFKSHDSGRCGLHIHLNRGRGAKGMRLGEATECKIAYFIHRQRAMFTKLARRGSGDYTSFVQKELKRGENRNGSRHEAVNFTYDTVELRLFRGTLRLNTFYATLEMADAIVRFCKNYSAARMVNATRARNEWLDFAQNNGYEYLPNYLIERSVI